MTSLTYIAWDDICNKIYYISSFKTNLFVYFLNILHMDLCNSGLAIVVPVESNANSSKMSMSVWVISPKQKKSRSNTFLFCFVLSIRCCLLSIWRWRTTNINFHRGTNSKETPIKWDSTCARGGWSTANEGQSYSTSFKNWLQTVIPVPKT